MIRKMLVMLSLAVLAVSSSAWADTNTVVMTLTVKESSTTYTGEVTKVAGGYQIKLPPKGNLVTIPAAKVTVSPSSAKPQEEYKDQLRNILGPANRAAAAQIGLWAKQQHYLDIAYKELGEALNLDPNNQVAQVCYPAVCTDLEDLAKASAKGVGPTTRDTGSTGSTGSTAAGGKDLIGDDDIYKIKMAEIRKGELSNVQVDFRNKVIDRFIKAMKGDAPFDQANFEAGFRGWPRAKQLALILDKLPNETGLLDDCLIQTDPQFMKVYRAVLRTSSSPSCARPSATAHRRARAVSSSLMWPTTRAPITRIF